MSVEGLWRDKERNILVRLRNVAVIKEGNEGNHRCAIEVLKGRIGSYDQGLKLHSVIPKRDFNIQLQEWISIGKNKLVTKVIIVPLPTVWDDFNSSIPNFNDFMKSSLGLPYISDVEVMLSRVPVLPLSDMELSIVQQIKPAGITVEEFIEHIKRDKLWQQQK